MPSASIGRQPAGAETHYPCLAYSVRQHENKSEKSFEEKGQSVGIILTRNIEKADRSLFNDYYLNVTKNNKIKQ